MSRKFKIILLIAGIIVVCVAIAFGALFYYGNKMDEESKAYVDANVPSIFGQWDMKKLIQNAGHEFLDTVKTPQAKEKLNTLFVSGFEKLGKIKQYKGSEGQAIIDIAFDKGITIYADYTATCVFQKGEAKISIRIIKKGDKWQIFSFSISSPAMLPSAKPGQVSMPADKKVSKKDAEAGKADAKPAEKLPDVDVIDTTKQVAAYEYSARGRKDPFSSLVMKAETEKKKGLIPLENYEVSEFKLIAILWDKTGHYAVITLPDGKSYTIRESVKLGLHGGKVYKITKDSVIIREDIRDYRGVLRPKDTQLKLRKGGEG
ncbi:MAG: hypothetical protein C0415_02370 [Thermodesulfovibrio sp.]|nr:hypothetical protein [Thermodesulfovibrio sp.]